jgi:hypothetical protein
MAGGFNGCFTAGNFRLGRSGAGALMIARGGTMKMRFGFTLSATSSDPTSTSRS